MQQWNLRKNLTSNEMNFMVSRQTFRRSKHNKDTEFTRGGKVVPAEKIERWKKRQSQDPHESLEYNYGKSHGVYSCGSQLYEEGHG
jgi:hypothetical protein